MLEPDAAEVEVLTDIPSKRLSVGKRQQSPPEQRGLKPRHDPLEHFKGDAPGWKLAALLICKGAGILGGATALLVALHAAGIL